MNDVNGRPGVLRPGVAGVVFNRFGFYKHAAFDHRVVHLETGLTWKGCSSPALADAFCHALESLAFFSEVTINADRSRDSLTDEQQKICLDLYENLKQKFKGEPNDPSQPNA